MKHQAIKVTVKLHKTQAQACTKKESCYAHENGIPS